MAHLTALIRSRVGKAGNQDTLPRCNRHEGIQADPGRDRDMETTGTASQEEWQFSQHNKV